MALQQNGGPAPYAPPTAVMMVVDQFRERGLQTPFTADVLNRVGVTEALAGRTLTALQMLDFIDEAGNPTDTLNALRVAPTDEFPDRLAAHIREVYAPIFAFTDPAHDTTQRVRDAFRVYEPIGQQARMVTLFMGLCQRAGIVESAPARQSSQGSARTRPTVQQSRRQREQVTKKRDTIHDDPPPKDSTGIPEELLALMRKLPSDRRWAASEREKWLKVFTVVLDYSVEIAEPSEEED
jgi:hypothetical protein